MPSPQPSTGPAILMEAGKFYRLRNMQDKLYCIGKSPQGDKFVCIRNDSGNDSGVVYYYLNGKRTDLTSNSSSSKMSEPVMEWRELIRVMLTGFMNVYSDHSRSEWFTTKVEANRNVDSYKTRIACIDMLREVQEGEGLYE